MNQGAWNTALAFIDSINDWLGPGRRGRSLNSADCLKSVEIQLIDAWMAESLDSGISGREPCMHIRFVPPLDIAGLASIALKLPISGQRIRNMLGQH